MESEIKKRETLPDFLHFGMKLSVAIKYGPDDEYSLHTHLIGIREHQFLILDLTGKSVEDLITRRTKNVPVVIRGICDTDLGHIMAFKSEIITITSRPVWLMFVKLPYEFETIAIRSNKRFKLDLPVIIKHNGDEHKARLKDLSVSGCGISIADTITIEKEASLEIQPRLKHFPEHCPPCKVVNLRKHNQETLLGVKFEKEIDFSEPLKFEIADHIITRNH